VAAGVERGVAGASWPPDSRSSAIASRRLAFSARRSWRFRPEEFVVVLVPTDYRYQGFTRMMGLSMILKSTGAAKAID